jgi:septum site-determining protein MinD
MAQMKALLDELRMEFDYILIDSPAGVGLGFLLATFDADRVIVVTTPQVAALHDADRVLELLRENPTQKRQLLVNCFDRQMAKSGNLIEISAIRTLLDVDLIGVVSADRQIIISQNQGIPLSGNNTPACSCYVRIVRRILGEELPILEDRSAASRRFSFFHRVTDTSGVLTDLRRKEGVRT